MAMQAGTSGGLMPSECGRPIGIDRPAIYFRDTNFLLSHTGCSRGSTSAWVNLRRRSTISSHY